MKKAKSMRRSKTRFGNRDSPPNPPPGFKPKSPASVDERSPTELGGHRTLPFAPEENGLRVKFHSRNSNESSMRRSPLSYEDTETDTYEMEG
jgi:hypothetical protein